MNSGILDIAKKTIPEPNWDKVRVGGPDGMTEDIVHEIATTTKISVSDLRNFAPQLKGKTALETLQNDWNFVRNNIHYKLDPDGEQFIKTPSRTFWDGYADCKSFSIFFISLLKAQGFTNYGFRFVSYSDRSDLFTHVYPFVIENGQTYILDAVPGIPKFNFEKKFKHKKDLTMSQISRMSGLGNESGQMVKKVVNLGNRMPDEMTEGEIDLWIARDRMLTEKSIVEKIQGIGSLKAEKYQDSIDMLDDAIEAVQNATVNGIGAIDPDIEEELADIADMAVSGAYSLAREMAGIGSAKKKEKRKAKKAARKDVKAKKKELRKSGKKAELKEFRKSNKTKTGKFLQKVGRKVKAGAKGIVKVLTAPQRLAVKAFMELYLPKAAPAFLYLFVNDPALIAKLPPVALNKRKKAEKMANFICDTIGMKRSHFMGICRNGIMKEYGKSPESVIADQMKGMSGIGVAAILGTAFKFLLTLIGKISKLFGKKPEEMPTEDEFLPDPSSEDEVSFDVADGIKSQASDFSDDEDDSPADEDNGGARNLWKSF